MNKNSPFIGKRCGVVLVAGVVSLGSTGCAAEGASEINGDILLETKDGDFVSLSTLDPQSLPLELASGYTICSFSDQVIFEDTPTRRLEEYNFSLLSEALEESLELVDTAGINAVSNCEEARIVVEALNETGSTNESEVGSGEYSEELVEKIHLGESVSETTGGVEQGGIVQLTSRGCTGFFISGRHLLTAAHCVPGTSGTMNITYEAPGLPARTDSFTYVRPSHYQSGLRSADYAVLNRVNGNLAWADSSRRFRLYTGSTHLGTQLHVYGYGARTYNGSGANAGVLRTGHDFVAVNLNFHQDGFFRATAHTARTCAGDSGGPAVRQVSGYNVVWGIYGGRSGDSVAEGDACAHEGDYMYWAKTNAHIGYIEEQLGYTRNRSFGNSDGTYARCW